MDASVTKDWCPRKEVGDDSNLRCAGCADPCDGIAGKFRPRLDEPFDRSVFSLTVARTQMEDVAVTAVRTTPYNAVQIGIKNRREKTTHNALLGQFRKNGVDPKYKVAEFRVTDDAMVEPGDAGRLS